MLTLPFGCKATSLAITSKTRRGCCRCEKTSSFIRNFFYFSQKFILGRVFFLGGFNISREKVKKFKIENYSFYFFGRPGRKKIIGNDLNSFSWSTSWRWRRKLRKREMPPTHFQLKPKKNWFSKIEKKIDSKIAWLTFAGKKQASVRLCNQNRWLIHLATPWLVVELQEFRLAKNCRRLI